MRKLRKVFVIGAVMLAGLAIASPAQATKPDPLHKVQLCHRTHSETNPYVVINVDVASVKFEGHDSHEGPIWYPGAKADGVRWGDIIPAFTEEQGYPFDYPGKNVPEGQEWLDNDCENPAPPTSTPPPTTTPPPSETTPPPTTTVPPTTGPPGNTTGTNPPPTDTVRSRTGSNPPSPLAVTGGDAVPPTIAGLLLLTAGIGATLWARRRSG